MKCWEHVLILQCCMAVCLTSVSCFWPAPGPSLKACQQCICRPDSHSVNLQEQTAHEQTDITLIHNSPSGPQFQCRSPSDWLHQGKSFCLRPGNDAYAYAVCCNHKKNGFQTPFSIILHFLSIHHGYSLCIFEHALRQ